MVIKNDITNKKNKEIGELGRFKMRFIMNGGTNLGTKI